MNPAAGSHLATKASTIVDVGPLIESGQVDANGHTFPMTETAGSAIIRSSAAGNSLTPLTLVVTGGTFNVQTATCGETCVWCCGFTGFTVIPNAFACPIGDDMQCSAQATDCNGNVNSDMPVSSWTSSNTALATIDGSGLMTGVGVGSVTSCATRYELETWLLADQDAVNRVARRRQKAGRAIAFPDPLEGTRDAKERFLRMLSQAKLRADPTVYAEVASEVDLIIVEQRYPYFRQFVERVHAC